ncbi:MAG: hypothetical protein M0T73_18055 [Deltaproteobacteria bacterium]|nr:hypothetical protein [Deltaproteobacteria bacterium]
MESMPFLYANNIFTITFEDDLAFTEVRSILDQLLERNAFNPKIQEKEGAYCLTCGAAQFSVWVVELEVIIRRDQTVFDSNTFKFFD